MTTDLHREPTPTIDPEYTVTIDGKPGGTVWKVPGRSFSGAWRAATPDGGIRTGIPTRKAAVEHLERHAERMIKTVMSSDIERCPIRSFSPSHYYEDGMCHCGDVDPFDMPDPEQ